MKKHLQTLLCVLALLLVVIVPALADGLQTQSAASASIAVGSSVPAADESQATEEAAAVLALPTRSLKCSANNLWIDLCNGTVQPDERLVHMDLNGQDEITLSGWSADLLAGTPLQTLYVQVGYQLYPCEYGAERTTVSDYFGNENLKNVGFEVTIPAAAFQSGAVEALKFIEVSQDGSYRYEDSAYSIDYAVAPVVDEPNTMEDSGTSLARVSVVVLCLIAILGCAGLFFLYGSAGKDGESLRRFRANRFLFSQLVKRDFTLKYKRTVLGMLWSILSPLLNLFIMWLVFNRLLGSNIDHFVVYLFAGQLVLNYFNEATNLGMTSLLDNAEIFSKVNVPKYLFLFSRNISTLINFGLTVIVFFVFVALEGIPFSFKFLLLIYPVICLIILNLGVGMILSALFMFFRDMRYLWGIATQLIMWMSAVFYSIDGFSASARNLFLLNPVYLCIRYFRKIVLENTIPSPQFHLLLAFFALVFFGLGCLIYKKKNQEFLYYI